MIPAATILKVVLKAVWPWVERNVLPLLLDHLARLVLRRWGRFSGSVNAKVDERMRSRASGADGKAEAAERLARNADTPAERQKHEAVAQAWREIAEQFRAENEALKAQLERLSRKERQDMEEGMRRVNPRLEQNENGTVLNLDGESHTLPSLPDSADRKNN